MERLVRFLTNRFAEWMDGHIRGLILQATIVTLVDKWDFFGVVKAYYKVDDLLEWIWLADTIIVALGITIWLCRRVLKRWHVIP